MLHQAVDMIFTSLYCWDEYGKLSSSRFECVKHARSPFLGARLQCWMLSALKQKKLTCVHVLMLLSSRTPNARQVLGYQGWHHNRIFLEALPSKAFGT